MREMWMRVGGAAITGAGLLIAVFYPKKSCGLPAGSSYIPLGGIPCDSHLVLRIAIVGVSVAVGALLFAFASSSATRPHSN